MTKVRDIAKMLNTTEQVNSTNQPLAFTVMDSAQVTTIASAASGSFTSYTSIDSLPISGVSAGSSAYVTSSQRYYIYEGSGWYNIAVVNYAPTMSLSPSGTIILSNDGVTTSTVTITATDPEKDGLTYTVESDGNGIGLYELSQDSSVFTIRPLSEDSGATAGTFTLTFKTTDAVSNFVTAGKDFSLTFSNIVDSSAETVLLMKATGNSTTNAAITFLDTNETSQNFTETNSPQASTFSPYRSGGYSTYFDGSGDYLQYAASNSTVVNWHSQSTTMEAWIYLNSSSDHFNDYPCIFSNGEEPGSAASTNYWGFGPEGATPYLKFQYYNGSTQAVTSSTQFPLHEWVHVAMVHSSGAIKLYQNGVEVASASVSGTPQNSSSLGLVTGGAKNGVYDGYIKDARLVHSAVYTAAFTPPTEALTAITNTQVLLCHLPYIADGSTNDFAITVGGNTKTVPFGPYDYSAWTADDVGGSLHTPTNNSYVSSTGVPQVGSTGVAGHLEFWWYPISTTAGSGYSYVVLGNDMSSGNYIEWNSSVTRFQIQTGGGVTTQMLWTNATMLNVAAWNHIWVQKNASNYWDVWINGKNLGTVSSSYGQTHTGAITPQIIGAGFSSTYGATQHIADMKIGTDIKSTTADFTPPTAPLSHDANTTFLMNNKSDANVYDAAAGNVFKLNGNTASTTSQRKFTTSSAVTFDGTGDTAVATSSDIFAYGTGDFTWEAWIYVPAAKSNHYLLDHGSNGGTMNIANTKIRYYNSTIGISSALYTTGATISYATWHHVAFVRSSGTTTIYLDGTAGSSASDTHNYTAQTLTIGDYGGGSYGYAGTLQDLRITKGLARYTANFTAPTTEFEL